jgi:hypothetical protein
MRPEEPGRGRLRVCATCQSKLGVQLGIDMAGNILKEFWPDFERKFSRKHQRNANH